MCCHMLLDSTLPTVPKVLTGTHWNKMGNILSNYHLKLSSEKKTGFCHWNVRLMGWGWRNDVMYFIHGSFTLIPPWITESTVWVSSFWGPEGYITVQAVRYYAWCIMLHVIEFLLEKPLPDTRFVCGQANFKVFFSSLPEKHCISYLEAKLLKQKIVY